MPRQMVKMIGRRVVPALLFLFASHAMAQVDTVRRGAAITIKVESFREAESQVTDLVAKHGGVEGDRSQSSSAAGRHSGWTRVIVPKAQLDSFLADLRTLGKVYGEKLSLADGAWNYKDLENRAKRLEQHEERLEGILNKKRGLRGSDILFIQERLYRASTDQDTLTEQREAIPLLAAKSSVIVDLFEPAPVKLQPRGFFGHAKLAFDDAVKGLALGLLGWISPLMNLAVLALVVTVVWFAFRRPVRSGLRKLKTSFQPNEPPKPPVAP